MGVNAQALSGGCQSRVIACIYLLVHVRVCGVPIAEMLCYTAFGANPLRNMIL